MNFEQYMNVAEQAYEPILFHDPFLLPQDFQKFDDDLESNNLIEPKKSKIQQAIFAIQQVLQQQSMNMRTTHINQIIAIAEKNYSHLIGNWKDFKKAILKRKRSLKRQHAKERNISLSENFRNTDQTPFQSVSSPEVKNKDSKAQRRRKRNRLNAQLSRDKKKTEFNELQMRFQDLKNESSRMKKENEKLKKELSCFKSKESFTLPTNYIKNKFMSFIVILGIVFLLSLFKDVWRQKTESNIASFQDEEKNHFWNVQRELQYQFSRKGKDFLSQISPFYGLENPHTQNLLKQEIIKSLRVIDKPNQMFYVPQSVLKKIQQINEEMI